MDDFAWLGLREEFAASPGSLLSLLFEPRAQGTVRIFSERLYFLLLGGIFGLEAWPFRIFAFGLHFFNLWLIVKLALKLSKSLPAAFLAAVFYACSPRLVRPLAWASSFNQILAATCILGAFYFYLRWIDRDQPRDWWIQYAIYVASLGVLESAMMYPLVASAYAFAARSRKAVYRTLWLWPPTILFLALHLWVIPKPESAKYQMILSNGIFESMARYTGMAAGPENAVVSGVLAGVFLGVLLWRSLKLGDTLPLFYCLWFTAFIAPVLPFQNTISDYYVVMPMTGIALCVANLASTLRRSRRWFQWAVVGVLALLYAIPSAMEARPTLHWLRERSDRIRRLLDAGVQVAAAKQADTLLLSGVDSDLYNTALQDSPFRLVGLNKVFLVPGSEAQIRARADLGGIQAYRISLPQAIKELESGKAAVLSIAGREIHDATARYKSVAMQQYLERRPQQVNAGEPGYDSLLGEGWFPIEDRFRWMGRKASVRLGGPVAKDQRLVITGFCPETVAAKGPITLLVKVNGEMAAGKTIIATEPFTISVTLPQIEKEWIEIELETSRVTNLPGDKRELGLIFGTFSIQQ